MKRPRINKNQIASSASETVNKVYTKKMAESFGVSEEHMKEIYGVLKNKKKHDYSKPNPKGYTVNVTLWGGTKTFFVPFKAWEEMKNSYEGMSITIKPVW